MTLPKNFLIERNLFYYSFIYLIKFEVVKLIFKYPHKPKNITKHKFFIVEEIFIIYIIS